MHDENLRERCRSVLQRLDSLWSFCRGSMVSPHSFETGWLGTLSRIFCGDSLRGGVFVS